jgi:lysophospholipase L1-like esterase
MKKILIFLLLLPSVLLAQTTLDLPYSVRVKVQRPADAYYYNLSFAPYTSTSQVIAEVPSTLRYKGQKFKVGNLEYVFDTGILDADLVVYIPGMPSQTGNSGKYLTTNGTSLSWIVGGGGWATAGTTNLTGSVDISGPTYNLGIGTKRITLNATDTGLSSQLSMTESGVSLFATESGIPNSVTVGAGDGTVYSKTVYNSDGSSNTDGITYGMRTKGSGPTGSEAQIYMDMDIDIKSYTNYGADQMARLQLSPTSINLGIDDFAGSASAHFTFTSDAITLDATKIELSGGALTFPTTNSIATKGYVDAAVAGGGGGGSGTVNSATANRLAYYSSTGTAVSGLTAITANKALASNSSGLPVASSVTDSELANVAGTTSNIQTQLNSKNGIIGDVYNEDFTGGIGNYTGTGSSVLNYTGGHMVVTGGTAGVNTSKVTRNSLQTSYDKFYRIVRFSVGANVSGETIGIGVSPNSYLNPAFSFYATFNTAATTNRGQIKLHGVQGTDLVKVTSATNLSYTNGDVINFKIVFAGPSTIDILAVNETVPTSNPVHITFAADNNTGSTFFGTATFTTVLYPMGATWTVISDVFGSTSMLNPTLVRIGDSITQGHGSGSPSQRDANILNQIIPGGVNVFAGGGNVSLDVLNTLPQVIAMKPKYVAVMVGTNDLGNGVSLGTVSTSGTYLYNMNSIIRSLISNNIVPIVLYMTPSGDPTIVTWNTALTTNFSSICSVQDWFSVIAAGSIIDSKYTVDGLHLNALGYAYITDKFLDLNPHLQGPKQFGRFPSISFDGADLTVDALGGTGNRLTFANSTGKFSFSNNVRYTDTGISSKPTVIIGGTNGGNVQLDYVAGQSSNIVGSDTGTPQMGIAFNSAGTYGGTGRAVGFYDYVTGVFRAGVGSGGDFVVGQSNGTYGVKITQSGDIVMNGILNTGAIAGVVGGVTQYYLAFDNSANYGGSGRTWSLYDNQGGGYRIGVNSNGDYIVGASNSNYGFKATQSGEVTFKGLTTAFTTRTATYAVSATDHIVNCKTNSFSILLPASAVAGKEYVVYNAGPATTITLTPNGTDTINSLSSDTVTTGAKTLVFDGISNWISF